MFSSWMRDLPARHVWLQNITKEWEDQDHKPDPLPPFWGIQTNPNLGCIYENIYIHIYIYTYADTCARTYADITWYNTCTWMILCFYDWFSTFSLKVKDSFICPSSKDTQLLLRQRQTWVIVIFCVCFKPVDWRKPLQFSSVALTKRWTPF